MNGYFTNGGYDADGMDQSGQYGSGDGNMIPQDQMGGGMMGGQSLDEILNQNVKTSRRPSLRQQYSSSMGTMDVDMRRISMMDYGATSPAGPMGNFGMSAGMESGGLMQGASPMPQMQQRTSQSANVSRRQSAENGLALNTNFGSNPQAYNPMMAPNSAFASPAHPQSSVNMGMSSPYADQNLSMSMDALGNNKMGDDQMGMNMYNQPQFSTSMVGSPLNPNAQQGTPMSGNRLPSNDAAGSGNSGGITPFGPNVGNTGRGSVRNALSRSHSLQIPEVASPAAQAGTPLSQPDAASVPQQAVNQGFQGQPQYPFPGSKQDRGMGNSTFNGVNGPLPVNPGGYNPNNQNFPWEPPEGGWPSTMVGRPHMQSSYKNAYSSTGFDMLGVLVCFTPMFSFCVETNRY